jgi:Xaa-Pro aminopeptidase
VSGPQTALPHAYTASRTLSEGDVVISGVVVNVGGYLSELERTMIVGEPTAEQLNYLDIVTEAQSLTIEVIEPGVDAGYVEAVSRAYFEEQGVSDLIEHHVGHAIGLEPHEPPYLDCGSDAVLNVGDVYAIEPAIYTDSEGYRHSDTLVVTENGHELLTRRPKSREFLILSDD